MKATSACLDRVFLLPSPCVLAGGAGGSGGLEAGWRTGGWEKEGWRVGGVLRYSAVRIGSIGSVRGQVISDTCGSVCDPLRFAIRVLLKQPRSP